MLRCTNDPGTHTCSVKLRRMHTVKLGRARRVGYFWISRTRCSHPSPPELSAGETRTGQGRIPRALCASRAVRRDLLWPRLTISAVNFDYDLWFSVSQTKGKFMEFHTVWRRQNGSRAGGEKTFVGNVSPYLSERFSRSSSLQCSEHPNAQTLAGKAGAFGSA